MPGRNGAEIVIEALNAGNAPAPYNTVGLGGTKIDTKYVDEAGSTAQVVTEFRNLVQRDQVDAVVGYISSGSCLAVTPVADELKALTVYFDCGTPRIFEEKPRKYVFRASPHATMDNTGAARYLLAKKKDVTLFPASTRTTPGARIPGATSWRRWACSRRRRRSTRSCSRSCSQGEFGAEISTLLTSKSQALHSSFWDGDLGELHLSRASARGLRKRMPFVGTTAESAIWRLRDKMPDGTIVGAPRPARTARARQTRSTTGSTEIYFDRYGTPPTYPSYQMALSILGLKVAWEKAQKEKGGGKPTTDEVATAFEGHRVRQPERPGEDWRSATATRASRTPPTAPTASTSRRTQPEVVDIVRFAAECVNPPPGITADEWIKAGMPGAKCLAHAPWTPCLRGPGCRPRHRLGRRPLPRAPGFAGSRLESRPSRAKRVPKAHTVRGPVGEISC